MPASFSKEKKTGHEYMNDGMGIYSFLQPVADLIGGIITALYDVTAAIGFPSYALAIILISVLIKILLYPLMTKQMKSMMNMQEVQPKLEYLQKKYKNNPEKMNEEVMKLYKEYKINPMGGCLPLLIQMPILIGLFGALRQYHFENLEHAAFFWIPNLGDKDPFFILPVLVALTMFLQQKISMGANPGAMANNPTMKTMLYVMPAMMLFICWTMPAGLCLYWGVFSILSIFQQQMLNKAREKEKAARAAELEAEKARKLEERKAQRAASSGKPSKKKKAKKPQKEESDEASDEATEEK